MNYDNPELIDRLAAHYVHGSLRGPARLRFERLLMREQGVARPSAAIRREAQRIVSSLLGVAIDYSLILVTRWREERDHGKDNHDAVVAAVKAQADKREERADKKAEEKKKELQEFIARFSANVAKSKQATARKKMLEKLNIEEIQPSTRKYPGIIVKQGREVGDQILTVENLSAKAESGELLFSNVNFTVSKGDKIAFISRNTLALNQFFKTLWGEVRPATGEFNWGVTVTMSNLPNENAQFFTEKINLVDWLRQYSVEKDETYVRGFLGRMLFSGEETQKMCTVLSGGEKVRCMLSKLMLENPNVLLLDEPTNHLDLESIQALNNGLVDYAGVVLFHSHDQEFINSIANRIIEITPNGIIDKYMSYEEFAEDAQIKERKAELYKL